MLKAHVFHSLVLCSLFSIGFTDQGINPWEDEEVTPQYESNENDNEEYCDTRARPVRITMRHIENRGIGYNTGYTTLEGFFALAPRSNVVPFLDLRGHIFNDNKWAANGGLGLRYLPDDVEVVFGINAFYDFRHVTHKSFQQAGAGLEFLGHVWEGRINGYLPFGDKRGPYSETKFDGFKGNHIILQRRAQFAMRGIDAEAGAYLCQMEGFNAFFGAGPYGFAAERGKSAIGAKGRLTVDFSDYVTAEVTASYDSVFRGIVQGELMINIPFFLKKTTKRPKGALKSCETWTAMKNRLLDRVNREEIIVVKKEKKRDTAIDPTTGKPYHVLFVNNTSHSAGTYQSPFNTLSAAETASSPGDIIYVYSGDGTTTGMDQGITLQNNQRLWGAATRHHLNTTLGRIVVPQHDTVAPIITNSATGVVQIANNNEISGFTIESNGSTFGIFQVGGMLAPFLSNARISNNSFIGSGSVAVNLLKMQGIISVANNSSTQNINLVLQSAQNALVTLQDNTIDIPSALSQDGVDLRFFNCSNSTAKILNNSVNNGNFSNLGMIIRIQNATEKNNSLIISGNNITSVNDSIEIDGENNSNPNINVSNNTLKCNSGNAIVASFNNGGTATFANNNITSGSIQVVALGGLVAASIINNNISAPASGGSGIIANIDSPATLQCIVTNNIISVPTSTQILGAAADFENGSNLCLTFNDNIANFVVPQAFLFDNAGGGNFFVTPPMNNVGNILENGTITQVTTLPCGL